MKQTDGYTHIMYESQYQYAEEKKLDIKEYILYEFSYIRV